MPRPHNEIRFDHLMAPERYSARHCTHLASQRACISLFVHGSSVDRSGADDPDADQGYVFAIRSERLLCREVQGNLAYRWFCKLGIEDAIPDHSAFSRARNERFREGDVFRRVFERVVEAWIAAGLVGGEGRAVDASLIQADANKQRSIAGQDWRKDRDPARSSRAVKEYLARRGAPPARLSRSSSHHPIPPPSGPALTRGRHSLHTPTIISST